MSNTVNKKTSVKKPSTVSKKSTKVTDTSNKPTKVVKSLGTILQDLTASQVSKVENVEEGVINVKPEKKITTQTAPHPVKRDDSMRGQTIHPLISYLLTNR